MNKTLIIAEAGVNHNGSLKRCFQLVDAAKKAGATAIISYGAMEIAEHLSQKDKF